MILYRTPHLSLQHQKRGRIKQPYVAVSHTDDVTQAFLVVDKEIVCEVPENTILVTLLSAYYTFNIQ